MNTIPNILRIVDAAVIIAQNAEKQNMVNINQEITLINL